MTDASLYNGQKTDTSSECHGARLTSGTPLTDMAKSGVSVENVPSATKQWFVLRVSYGRIQKAKEFVEAHQQECYVPMRHKQVVKGGKRRIVIAPLLPSFIFVRATSKDADNLLAGQGAESSERRPVLSYYYDHTSYRKDAPGFNLPMTICDAEMDNFIKLTSVNNSHIIPVTSDHIQYKLGDNVVIADGEFKGIRGRVARIAGQQRVVVELFDGCMVATAYIPKEAMKRID